VPFYFSFQRDKMKPRVLFLTCHMKIKESIDHIFILGIGLELACNGGSCGGISLKKYKCYLHIFPSNI